MIKKVFSNSVIYAIGPQIPRIVGFFLLPLLTPSLSQVDFGVWGTITAFTLFFYSARDLGMVVSMFNSYYKNQNHWKWVWRQIMGYLFTWGIVVAIVQSVILFIAFPSDALSNRTEVIALLAIQCLLFDVPILIGSRYYQAAEKPMIISIVSILSGTIAVAAQYYFIAVAHLGYMGWFYSTFISLGVMSILYWILLFQLKLTPLFVFRKRLTSPRLRVALPMLPHNYSAYLLNASDRVLLTVFKTPSSQIGLYNVAYMWGNYMEIIGNAIGMAVGPMYFKLYKESNNRVIVEKFTGLLQLLFLAGSFVVAIWTKELFSIFIRNNSLTESYSLAIIVIMSYAYRPIYWAVVNRMQFDEQTSKLWRISFIAGIINIVLNLVLIPLYGYKAAAITTMIAMMYQGFAGYFIKGMQNDMTKKNLLFWFVAIIGISSIAYLLKDITPLIKLVITIFVIGFVLSKTVKFSKTFAP